MANWASVANLGDPRAADWQAQNLVPVTAGGQTWQVHRMAAPAFEGFLNELAATGYPLKSSGGFNYRNIRGSNRLSQHAFGTAIDLNAAANPMLTRGAKVKTDLPANVGEMAARYGLEWGGNWRRPDAMHFEYKGGGATPPTDTLQAPSIAFPGLPPGPEDAAVAAYQRPMPFTAGYGFQDFMQAGIGGTLRNDLRAGIFSRIGKLFGI